MTLMAAVRNIKWMSRLEEKVEQLQFSVKVVMKSFNLIWRKKMARHSDFVSEWENSLSIQSVQQEMVATASFNLYIICFHEAAVLIQWHKCRLMRETSSSSSWQDLLEKQARKWVGSAWHQPGQKDALHHVEVLHEHISVRLGGEVPHCIANPELNGSLQGRWRGLDPEKREGRRSVRLLRQTVTAVPACIHQQGWRENNRRSYTVARTGWGTGKL